MYVLLLHWELSYYVCVITTLGVILHVCVIATLGVILLCVILLH